MAKCDDSTNIATSWRIRSGDPVMSNNIIRLLRALQSSRPVAALLGSDPWKTRFRAYARGPAPVSHVNQVKTAFGAAALLSASAVIMAWNGVWWYFLFALLGSVLTLGLAWTMPSMEYKHLEASALERGAIIFRRSRACCGRRPGPVQAICAGHQSHLCSLRRNGASHSMRIGRRFCANLHKRRHVSHMC